MLGFMPADQRQEIVKRAQKTQLYYTGALQLSKTNKNSAQSKGKRTLKVHIAV